MASGGSGEIETALFAYVRWCVENRGESVILQEPPKLPVFANLLTGQADAIVKNQVGREWPVLVQTVTMSECKRFGLRSMRDRIVDVCSENLELTPGTRELRVKLYSPLNYACQNIMLMYCADGERMDVIFYETTSKTVFVVPVLLDKLFHYANLQSALDYLASGPEFLLRSPSESIQDLESKRDEFRLGTRSLVAKWPTRKPKKTLTEPHHEPQQRGLNYEWPSETTVWCLGKSLADFDTPEKGFKPTEAREKDQPEWGY